MRVCACMCVATDLGHGGTGEVSDYHSELLSRGTRSPDHLRHYQDGHLWERAQMGGGRQEIRWYVGSHVGMFTRSGRADLQTYRPNLKLPGGVQCLDVLW